MAVPNSIIKRIDHIIIRVDMDSRDQLFSFLSDTLRLPIAWPVTCYPSFMSGGIFVGNVNVEILSIDASPGKLASKSSPYGLFGIAFEPYPLFESIRELKRRGIPHLPPTPSVQRDANGENSILWTNIFLGKLLESNLWMDFFFFLGRVIPKRLWMRASSSTSPSKSSVKLLFDKVYQKGIFFLVEYNKQFSDVVHERAEKSAELQEKIGGPLGLIATQEIVVGVTDFKAAQTRWQKLFAPTLPTSPGRWQLGDGPAIRLVSHAHNGLLSLVWKVSSLERAEMFLSEHELLGTVSKQHITINPEKMHGVDIHLVE